MYFSEISFKLRNLLAYWFIPLLVQQACSFLILQVGNVQWKRNELQHNKRF